MYKSLYLTENSTKSLLRTEGIVSSALLVYLLALISFLAMNGRQLLQKWQESVLLEVAKGDGMAQSNSMVLIPLQIFSAFAMVIAVISFGSLVAYIRSLFKQYAIIQRKDFTTMSFIGETTGFISLEFALQPVLLSFVVLHLASLTSSWLYLNHLAETATRDAFGGNLLNVHQGFYTMHWLPMLLCCGYVALRTFFYVRKYLFSMFDNLQPVD